MEAKKLEKSLIKRAIELGYRLPDGSPPPSDFFSPFVTTPHRRQLWSLLVDSVHSRSRVEFMRKQILVTKLKQGKKNVKNCDIKQVTDRLELWTRQNALEKLVKAKKKQVAELEENIMAKVSDVLFEICKLAESEKKCEDYKEKVLVLRLFCRREKKLIDELKKLIDAANFPLKDCNCQDNKNKYKKLIGELTSLDMCESINCFSHCKILTKLKEINELGINGESSWEDILKHKCEIWEEFSKFIEGLNTSEKKKMREKEEEIESELQSCITQLKQTIMEKSLQIILNETDRRLLNKESERLMKMVEKVVFKGTEDPSFSNNASFLSEEEASESFLLKEQTFTKLKNHVNYMGMKTYQEYLKSEISKLKNDSVKLHSNESSNDEKEYKETLKSIKMGCDKIGLMIAEKDNQDKNIKEKYRKTEIQQLNIRSEINENNYSINLEKITDKLKTSLDEQVELFLDTPVDAFRTIESPSGRIIFERESSPHCLSHYGGEFKQFFSSMLISPFQSIDLILTEVTRRKMFANKLKNFIMDGKNLAKEQRECFLKLGSITYDSKTCEKNFKDGEGILWNVTRKADELTETIQFVQKVFKNWVEQPYRHMIRDAETADGMTLGEYEEEYKNSKEE